MLSDGILEGNNAIAMYIEARDCDAYDHSSWPQCTPTLRNRGGSNQVKWLARCALAKIHSFRQLRLHNLCPVTGIAILNKRHLLVGQER